MTQTDTHARSGAVAAEPARPAAPVPAPREPTSEEELLERARRLREKIDSRGGINLSPADIKAMIEEGRP